MLSDLLNLFLTFTTIAVGATFWAFEVLTELLSEADHGLLPWAHAVRVCRIPWDPDTITPSAWDAVAETVHGACRFAR